MEDITLAAVTPDPDTDSVVTANKLPALVGNGPSNLNCGGCGEVIGKGLDTGAIGRSFQTKRRLILACVCGASNLIHEAKADEEGDLPA